MVFGHGDKVSGGPVWIGCKVYILPLCEVINVVLINQKHDRIQLIEIWIFHICPECGQELCSRTRTFFMTGDGYF